MFLGKNKILSIIDNEIADKRLLQQQAEIQTQQEPNTFKKEDISPETANFILRNNDGKTINVEEAGDLQGEKKENFDATIKYLKEQNPPLVIEEGGKYKIVDGKATQLAGVLMSESSGFEVNLQRDESGQVTKYTASAFGKEEISYELNEDKNTITVNQAGKDKVEYKLNTQTNEFHLVGSDGNLVPKSDEQPTFTLEDFNNKMLYKASQSVGKQLTTVTADGNTILNADGFQDVTGFDAKEYEEELKRKNQNDQEQEGKKTGLEGFIGNIIEMIKQAVPWLGELLDKISGNKTEDKDSETERPTDQQSDPATKEKEGQDVSQTTQQPEQSTKIDEPSYEGLKLQVNPRSTTENVFSSTDGKLTISNTTNRINSSPTPNLDNRLQIDGVTASATNPDGIIPLKPRNIELMDEVVLQEAVGIGTTIVNGGSQQPVKPVVQNASNIVSMANTNITPFLNDIDPNKTNIAYIQTDGGSLSEASADAAVEITKIKGYENATVINAEDILNANETQLEELNDKINSSTVVLIVGDKKSRGKVQGVLKTEMDIDRRDIDKVDVRMTNTSMATSLMTEYKNQFDQGVYDQYLPEGRLEQYDEPGIKNTKEKDVRKGLNDAGYQNQMDYDVAYSHLPNEVRGEVDQKVQEELDKLRPQDGGKGRAI